MSAAPVIATQFNGPDSSGNGGYTAGLVGQRLASRLGPGRAVTVTLRVPPPLERPLVWRDGPDTVALLDGDTIVADAVPGDLDPAGPPAPIDPAAACAAQSRYEGRDHHPFPRCFTCGTARRAGDGLGIYAGPIGAGQVAATWSPLPAFSGPDGLTRAEICWAAIDCPGAWAAGIAGRPLVLGRMTALVLRRPRAGELCVVVAGLRRVEGRKHFSATALYGAGGDLLARAEQTWLAVDPATFT